MELCEIVFAEGGEGVGVGGVEVGELEGLGGEEGGVGGRGSGGGFLFLVLRGGKGRGRAFMLLLLVVGRFERRLRCQVEEKSIFVSAMSVPHLHDFFRMSSLHFFDFSIRASDDLGFLLLHGSLPLLNYFLVVDFVFSCFEVR